MLTQNLSRIHTLIHHFRWVKANIVNQNSEGRVGKEILGSKMIVLPPLASLVPPYFLTNLSLRKDNNNDTCMRHRQFPSVELNLLGIISRGPDCILGDSRFVMYLRHNDYLSQQAMSQAEAPTSFSLSFVQCLKENIGKRSNYGNWMSWKLQICSALQHSNQLVG